MLRGIFFLLGKSLLFIFLLGLATTVFLYARTTIYEFPKTKPFTGAFFYNPYQNIGTKTLKANFHAHGIAWGSLTYGHNTDPEIFEAYQKKGYDISGISNYHSISDFGKGKTNLYLPIYEHGFNLFKSHCLALNSKKVTFLDFPLGQSTSHQQGIIEALKANQDAVAIAHPNLAGRSLADMKSLTHYDFMEVLNHYRISDVEYDAALCSGKLSWLISNDDTHDIRDETAFKIWNIIYCETRNVDSILSNMKKGMLYGVKTMEGKCTNYLESCQVRNDSLFVRFQKPVEHIDLHGGEAELLDYHHWKSAFVYKIKPTDDFIRIVAKNPKSHLYLNPIIRWDGKNLPLVSKIVPEVNWTKTWLIRGFLYLLLLELVGLIFRVGFWKRKISTQ